MVLRIYRRQDAGEANSDRQYDRRRKRPGRKRLCDRKSPACAGTLVFGQLTDGCQDAVSDRVKDHGSEVLAFCKDCGLADFMIT